MDVSAVADIARTLPPAAAIFVIAVIAFAVIWKALDVVSRVIRDHKGKN